MSGYTNTLTFAQRLANADWGADTHSDFDPGIGD